MKMTEFTWRAVLIGLVLSVVLGAANAYLGLRAGITIAATYPAAVIGMALLRIFKGSILEENICRTAGSIGESVAAGAIFTLPAFFIAKSWAVFDFETAYWKSTAMMLTGSVLGVLFVSLVRRVMVEDPELPFPESVAAAEIHKAGQASSGAAKFLFYNMIVGGVVYILGVFKLFAPDYDLIVKIGELGKSTVKLGAAGTNKVLGVGGVTMSAAPTVSPAYIGVGYIIGIRLAALQFSGGVLAWGVLIPALIYFLGPQLANYLPPGATDQGWEGLANAVWRFIVRPIAVGGMLVGAAFTLFKMRKNLSIGLKKAFSDLNSKTVDSSTLSRTDRYMSSKTVFALIGVTFIAMCALYVYMTGNLLVGIVAAAVMLVAGFFFSTVSGSLVGMIGSSNNPISGLTLSTLILAAILMVSLGATGPQGVVAVLGVAAVVCVAAAVAGELLQDFKVGYILGGTPRSIQIVELISVVVSSSVMFFPLMLLHEANIKQGGIGFGDKGLPAPQASLMALLAQGIVGGDMPWPLVGMGVFMGIAMIMMQVKSPMLVSVGMYLPFATTFAIFVGGIIRSATDYFAERSKYNAAQKARVENSGILVASGFIAGEALTGLVVAGIALADWKIDDMAIIKQPSYLVGMAVILLLGLILMKVPLGAAGSPDEPAPPTAMM